MKKTSYYLLCIIGFMFLAGCASGNHVSKQPAATNPVLTTQVGGIELGYRIVGKGDPLLMIVGYACTMDSWDPCMITELAQNHRVIMFDNRGTGHSTIDNTELTIARMTQDALGLLEALEIPKADVMGWSMGSIIAQEMLLASPDRMGKAVLYATAVDAKPVKEALDAMAALEQEELVDRLFPKAWKDLNPDIYSRLPGGPGVSMDVIKRQYAAIVDWKGSRTRLKKIDSNEVLILVGEEDRITPIDQNLAAAQQIPGAWLVRFKGADHWLMYQAPEEMAKTVDFFLQTRQNLLQ
jgi:pimeloyl-ACP methyl ester carboxylesterase